MESSTDLRLTQRRRKAAGVDLDVGEEILVRVKVLHHVPISADSARLGKRIAVFHHALEMKLESFFHVRRGLFDSLAHRGATENVRAMGTVAGRCLADGYHIDVDGFLLRSLRRIATPNRFFQKLGGQLHWRNLAILGARLGGETFQLLECLLAHRQLAMMDPFDGCRKAWTFALAGFKAGLQSANNLAEPVGAERPAPGFGNLGDNLGAENVRDFLDIPCHGSAPQFGKFEGDFEIIAVNDQADRALFGFRPHS
jgi:hypothetical protein